MMINPAVHLRESFELGVVVPIEMLLTMLEQEHWEAAKALAPTIRSRLEKYAESTANFGCIISDLERTLGEYKELSKKLAEEKAAPAGQQPADAPEPAQKKKAKPATPAEDAQPAV